MTSTSASDPRPTAATDGTADDRVDTFTVELDAAVEDETAAQTHQRYRDNNSRLAHTRRDIKARVDELAQLEPAARTAAQRRELGRLARDLDRVTAQMVEANYGLVRKYARRFSGQASQRDVEEYEQAGALGLMAAIDSFDPDAGLFSPWAWRYIQREVLQMVRAVDHPNMNMTDFEVQHKVRAAVREQEERNPDQPIDRAAAAHAANVTVQQVNRVLDKHILVSADAPVGEGADATVGDFIVQPEADVADEVIAHISQEALERHALPLLKAQELYVLLRYLGMDAEPAEGYQAIGESLGLSREAVRQAYLRAMAKLKHPRVLKACLQHMAR